MRVIGQLYNNEHRFVVDVVDATITDAIDVPDPQSEHSYIMYQFNSVLKLTTALEDEIYVVMPLDNANNALDLLYDTGSVDVTPYADRTFCNPGPDDIQHLSVLPAEYTI